jgi:hypothetical protein
MKVAIALLLVCAVAVNAQIQVCDPNLKVRAQAGRRAAQVSRF